MNPTNSITKFVKFVGGYLRDGVGTIPCRSILVARLQRIFEVDQRADWKCIRGRLRRCVVVVALIFEDGCSV